MDAVLWEYGGEIVRIPPFTVLAFPELFQNTRCPGVEGTFDHVLYQPKEQHLTLVDQKSADEFSYKKSKRLPQQDLSPHYSIQLGAYYDGLKNSPLKSMVKTFDAWICFISKKDAEVNLVKADELQLGNAKTYWASVAGYLERAELTKDDDGNCAVPGEVTPTTSWACSYCKFFKNWDECATCSTLAQVKEVVG